MSKKEGAVEEKSYKQGETEINHCILSPSPRTFHFTSPKGSSVACGSNKAGGEVFGVQLSLGSGDEGCFKACLLCFLVPK